MRPPAPARHRRPRTASPALALVAVLCVFAAASAPGAAVAAGASAPPSVCRLKPQPPLDVRLEPLDPLTPGRVARFRLVVVPRVPTEEVRVLALPAPGVTWIAGQRSARRAARRDQTSEFPFTVRVPRAGRHALYVQVEITAADGTVWRRGAGLGLGPKPRAERAHAVPDGRGGETIEYEAAPADQVTGGGR